MCFNGVKSHTPLGCARTGSELSGVHPSLNLLLVCTPITHHLRGFLSHPVFRAKEAEAPELSLSHGGLCAGERKQQPGASSPLNPICFQNVSFKAVMQTPAGTHLAPQGAHSPAVTRTRQVCSRETRRPVRK